MSTGKNEKYLGKKNQSYLTSASYKTCKAV